MDKYFIAEVLENVGIKLNCLFETWIILGAPSQDPCNQASLAGAHWPPVATSNRQSWVEGEANV